jgi:HK97 family phage portal protein
MSTQLVRVTRAMRVKAALARWLGVPMTFTSAGYWGNVGVASSSGAYVTPDRALQLSTVWACTRLLAETVSTLPCNFYQRTSSNERSPAREHNLYQILHNQPNADMTAAQFWECMMAAMLLWGDGTSEKIMSGETVIALNFLVPERVLRRRLPSGAIEWTYVELNGARRLIPEASLFHIPAFSTDGQFGLSTIEYGANVFGAAMAAESSAGKIFANGMQASGVLYVDKILNPKQRDDLRSSIENFTGTTNAGKTFVAEAGQRYEQLTIKPEDAQLLETRGFSVEEICRWFRVPPFMVGHSEKSTSWGTGIEQQMIGFLQFALRPWLTRIEQSIRRQLLTPAERQTYFAEFAIEGLMRADSAGRAAFYSTALQNGWMNRDEVRALENHGPMEGGHVFTVQSNLIAIEQLSEPGGDAGAKLRSALTNFLAVTDE